jgi:patatin-like phospholipase/acyl hydrolase
LHYEWYISTGGGVNNAQDDQFSVLSIDGGGVRGIFVAAVLDRLERDIGTTIADHFDLIVGTSTGGIIALGLGAGMSPGEILDLYVQKISSIFPPRRRVALVRPLSLVRAKYKPDGLREAVRSAFGDKLLCDSMVPLVIPSYNIGENDVYLFKTPHHERLRRDWSVPMWQVALATSAAPTFFPAYSLPDEHVRLVDGGVWANNPSMVGVVEAVSMFGQPLKRIRLLSVGTTVAPAHRPRKLDRGGLIQWVRSPNVTQVLMAGQSRGAFAQTEHLLGQGNAFRLNPPAPESLVKLDVADSRELLAAASHHSRNFSPTFATEFASHQRGKYTPLHTRKDTVA